MKRDEAIRRRLCVVVFLLCAGCPTTTTPNQTHWIWGPNDGSGLYLQYEKVALSDETPDPADEFAVKYVMFQPGSLTRNNGSQRKFSVNTPSGLEDGREYNIMVRKGSVFGQGDTVPGCSGVWTYVANAASQEIDIENQP